MLPLGSLPNRQLRKLPLNWNCYTKLLAQAVESELTNLLENNRSLTTENGKQAIVRNGYLPERTIQTGLGDIAVKIPKVRDRTGSGLKFNSSLVPPYLKPAEHWGHIRTL